MAYLTMTLATGGESNLPHIGFFLQNLTYSCQPNLTVVFVTLSMNNLSFRDKWRPHSIYFRFSLQV